MLLAQGLLRMLRLLLSRRVLENMQAVIDLGKQTITSAKHGMHDEPLSRSSNGHMLIAICPNQSELEVQQCETTNEPNESATSTSECPDAVSSSSESSHEACEPASSLHVEPGTVISNASQEHVSHKPQTTCKTKITMADRRRAFQTILKKTKNGIVDVNDKRKELEVIYGHNQGKDIVHALIGYKPKLERVPPDHNENEYQYSIASLSKDGEFTVHPWQPRSAGTQRRSVSPMPVALFCYRPAVKVLEPSVQQPDNEPQCVCCCQHDVGEPQKHDHEPSLETLYEESDWVDVSPNNPLSPQSRKAIQASIRQLRNASNRLTLSRLVDDPQAVRAELNSWLGPQACKLDSSVGLIEVFTGKAQLSQTFEKITGKASIKLGLEHGQDFHRVNDRRLLLLLIAYAQPDHVWFSWPCTHWGPWCNLNMSKSPEARDEILKERALARRYRPRVSEAWHWQKAFSGHCHAENPLSSLAWNELNIGDVWTCRIDQCALGLRSPKNGSMILKPTKIVSTQQSLIEELSTYRCHGNHPHEHLAGSFKGQNLTKWAETYPSKFCRVMVNGMSRCMKQAKRQSCHDVFAQELLEDVDMEADAGEQIVPDASSDDRQLSQSEQRAVALVRRLHVNTGHSSPEQLMRLANRCQASEEIKEAIRTFKCPVCEELKPPPSYRKATLAHAEQPNQIVGLDFVQVELKREDSNGRMIEVKKNVLTCVCLATDFCQQVVVEPGRYGLSKAFHEAWVRPFGPPKTVFMDPDHRNISRDFQQYLVHHNIQLLLAAAESHWQLGKVEISNRVLRNMDVRVWRTTTRSPKETIEMCATVRNDYLKKCGFSPSQWFLGREPRHAASLADVDEQQNIASQSQVLADPEFAAIVHLREEAGKAFMEEHAREVWRRAIAGRNRPMRGPYIVGQMVYMFRRAGRGQLNVRHGTWLGPGRIVGMESSRGGPIPRLIWVSFNGYLYRCSPEGLRPIPEDEQKFKELIKEMSVGQLHPELEQAEEHVAKRAGWPQFHDLMDHKPTNDDVELEDDLMDDPDDKPEEKEEQDPSMDQPRRVRVRFYRSPEYWRKRAAGEIGPHGALQEGPVPAMVQLPQDIEERDEKRRRVTIEEPPAVEQSVLEPEVMEPVHSDGGDSLSYTPSYAEEPSVSRQEGDNAQPMQGDSIEPEFIDPAHPLPPDDDDAVKLDEAVSCPIPAGDDEDLYIHHSFKESQEVFEMSMDVIPEDITDNPLCLWSVLEDCFQVNQPAAKQRRVEVSFRKLDKSDQKLFLEAMHKEWNSWIENKVTSLCKSKGINPERIIRARWVLVWKKSSDPDVKNRTPKARLVLVGWQDPELGQVATDSPTLRKESKSLVLSVCAASHWKIWGADIKTAFLSGDPQQRGIYFRPPREIKEWMNLDDTDLFRREKAAYGLAEAPRQWFLRLTRELREVGLTPSKLDPCLYFLRKDGKIEGICGIHVDDLLGGGTAEMDAVLERLKKRLPFGDYRTYTIRYTGVEIRQNPVSMEIEVGQENYIENLKEVPLKPLGIMSTKLQSPTTCEHAQAS